MLFSTFLWRSLHDYDVKPPNLTFYRGRGHTMTNFPSSFWTWTKSFKNSTPGKVASFWHIEWVQIDAIKFERMQIHFLYRRFYCRRRRPCLRSLIYRIRRVSGAIGTGFVLLFTSRCVNLKYNFLGWVTCQEISNSESEVNIFPGFIIFFILWRYLFKKKS